jgi:mRNA interferase RelE/StbE
MAEQNPFDIRVHDEAEKQIARHDRPTRKRILDRFEELKINPHPCGVETVTGCPGILRVKVGGLRVLYRVDDAAKMIFVEAVTPRGQSYKPRRLGRL